MPITQFKQLLVFGHFVSFLPPYPLAPKTVLFKKINPMQIII